MHIWTINKWEKNIAPNSRSGLRLRFDPGVDSEVRRACKDFAKWLRREYEFPMRVTVYVKNTMKIKAMDGDFVFGTCFRPYSYSVEPYIRIAAGDYDKRSRDWGKDSALIAIIQTIAHELTHYFQWANDLQLTPIGEERQATVYSRFILDEYFETREHP